MNFCRWLFENLRNTVSIYFQNIKSSLSRKDSTRGLIVLNRSFWFFPKFFEVSLESVSSCLNQAAFSNYRIFNLFIWDNLKMFFCFHVVRLLKNFWKQLLECFQWKIAYNTVLLIGAAPSDLRYMPPCGTHLLPGKNVISYYTIFAFLIFF